MTLDRGREQLMDLLEKRSGLDREEVRAQLELLAERIDSIVAEDADLQIEGFGIFSRDTSGVLRFVPSDVLEMEVNYRYVGLKPVEIAPASGSMVSRDLAVPPPLRTADADPDAVTDTTSGIGPVEGAEISLQRREEAAALEDETGQQQTDDPADSGDTAAGAVDDKNSVSESGPETKSVPEAVSGSESGVGAEAGSESVVPDPDEAGSGDSEAGSDKTSSDISGSGRAGKEAGSGATGSDRSRQAGSDQAGSEEDSGKTAGKGPQKGDGKVVATTSEEGRRKSARKTQPVRGGKRAGSRAALQLTAALMTLIVIGAVLYALFSRSDTVANGGSGGGEEEYVTPSTGSTGGDGSDDVSTGSGRSEASAGGVAAGGDLSTGEQSRDSQQSRDGSVALGGDSSGIRKDGSPAVGSVNSSPSDDRTALAERELQGSAGIEESGQGRSSQFGLYGSAVAQQSRHYSIILHSVRRESFARELQSALQDEGYRTVRYSVEHEEMGTMWRVGIGQFASVDDALEVAEDLPAPWRENHFIGSIPKH